MAQKRPSWMNLSFNLAPKTSSDVNSWGKHDAKLFAAVKKGDTEKVKSILKKGSVDPTKIEPSEGISSLNVAAANGKLDILNLLLTSQVNLEATDITGKTALHHAADKGRVDVTKRLLEAGANVSAVDYNRLSALHHACSSGMIGCLLELLAMPHSPVNARDKDGRSPLSYAAWKGQASLCKLLLEKGAEINSRDNNGCTPLILAGMNGSADLCSFLIAQGADYSLTDNHGHNALWHCSNSQRGAHLHAARVIQEAMTGHPDGRNAPVRAHSEREVAERSTASDLYEPTDENYVLKENLYEGINEQDYMPDYSDDDAPSSASIAVAATASAAGPWQDALYGNEPRPHIFRSDTYLMPSDEQRRNPVEATFSENIYNELQIDEFGGLGTTGGQEETLKTDDLLEGWRERLKKFEDESRSESEAEDNEATDPNQLLITLAHETTDLGGGGSLSAAPVAQPPLSPADTFFNNLMATIAQRDQPPMEENSKDHLLQYDVETTVAEQRRHSLDRSLSDDEMPFDTIRRNNMPSLSGKSETKNDAYQLIEQQLEHKYHSQLEDLERMMTDAHQSNSSLAQQLELSKDQTMQANKYCDTVKQRLESAVGIKNWLHNELQALYNSIETSENKLKNAGLLESLSEKSDQFDILSDLEGFKQHIDYMLETSNVDDHHSVDIDASTQKTSLKMMEIKLDRLVKENAELRAKIKEEQQRKADDRYDDFEKRMAHEYKKLDEEIEFKDADEMIAYIKDSITEISRLREQNATMSTRLQSIEDLGITDKRSLFSELERTQALNRNLMDKIMILQRSIDEQSGTIRETEQGFPELSDVMKSYGEVAVQRDIFAKEYENLKLLLEKKMAESYVSQDALRELDEMRKKQKELLFIVARMEETDQQKESDLQLNKKSIDDFEKPLEDYHLIVSERDMLRRDLHALSATKAEFDVNNTELNELRRINLDLSETKKELLETIERRDTVCDEKEKQIADLNRQLQDFRQLVTQKDTILRELESLRPDVDERLILKTYKTEKGDNDSVNEQGLIDDYGKLAVERDVLANEVKHLKALLDELKGSEKTLKQIQHEAIRTEKWNEDSDESDDDQKRESDLGKIAVERDVLITENKALKKLLEELQSSEGEIRHSPAQTYKAAKNNDDSDNEQRLIDDYGKLALERDVLANEVKHLKALLDEIKGSVKTVKQIHHETIRTEKQHEDSDESDDEEQKRERDIGKIAVEKDVLIAENKALKKLLEELQSSERAVKHSPVQGYKAERNNDDSGNEQLTNEDYGKLALERDVLANEVKHLKALLDEMKGSEKTVKQIHHELIKTGKWNEDSDVDERPTVVVSTAAESYTVPKKTFTECASCQEFGPLKLDVEKLREDLEKKKEKLQEAEKHNSELNELMLEYKKAENDRLDRIEELSQKVREFELLLDIKKEEHKTEMRITEAEHRKVLEMLSHKSDMLEQDLEEARERAGSLEKLKADIHTYDETIRQKNKQIEQLGEQITMLQKDALKRSAIDDDNDRIREEHRMMAREIFELKLALDSTHRVQVPKDREISAVKQVKSDLIMAPPPMADAIEEVRKLTAENAQLQERVADLEKAFLKRISTSSSLEHKDRPDDLDISDVDGRHEPFQIMDDKYLENSWKDLENFDTKGQQREASHMQKSGLKSYANTPFETWNDVLAEDRPLKAETDNTRKKMEAELADAKLRNVALKENNRDLQQEVRSLRKTVDELSSRLLEIDRAGWFPVHISDAKPQIESLVSEQKVSFASKMVAAKTAEDTLEKWKDVERLDKESTELQKEVEDRRREDRVIDSQPPFDEAQIRKITELMTANSDLINRNTILQSEVKELKAIVRSYRSVKPAEDSYHSESDESNEEQSFKANANQLSHLRSVSLDSTDEAENQTENYGKLAVERDILLNEVNALKKLVNNRIVTSSQSMERIEQYASVDNEKGDEINYLKKIVEDFGHIATERDILSKEVEHLKYLLDQTQGSKPTTHPLSVLTAAGSEKNKDIVTEKRDITQKKETDNVNFGKLAVERDILANEVEHLKRLLHERNGSEKTVTQIHNQSIRTEKWNEDSDDEQKVERDIGKIAVERDVLITENKALKKLLEELQSSERAVKHSPVQAYNAEKNNDDSDNDQHTNDDYGRLAVERDVLANEVKHLKALLDEMKGSVKTVKQIHHESIRTEKWNEVSDDSDDDQKREKEIGKIAVERDVLIAENKSLKKLLEELQSSETAVKHSTVHAYKAQKNNDDSDNDQHTSDDYGKLAVERDVLANEVKHLKALLDEMKGSEKAVKQIHHESIRTEKRNEDSDESDDDQKREGEIGKIAVERDVLITENKALKRLLEELQSSEREIKHSPVQTYKAEKNTDDSHNDQHTNDDYGKLAVERDVLANEVKHLKALLDERNGSEKTVTQIHHESIRTEKWNEDSDESDDDQKRERKIGKIAVERDVLIAENKALKKLLENLQSSEGTVKHSSVQAFEAAKNTDDSDNEQRLIDDYGKLAVERDVLANEVKHLKALLDEMKGSKKAVKQIHHESIRTEKLNEDSDESDDEQKLETDIGKIAVERDVLFTENKALKKLLEELQSSEREIKHSPVQTNKAEKNTDDSNDDQHTNDDYGKLALERDVLANEVKHLKALLDEMKGSVKTVKQIHHESIRTEKLNEDSDESDDEQKLETDIGKIAVERDVLFTENKALKKLLEELQSSEREIKHSPVQTYKAEKNTDDSDDDQHTNDDYGKLALERDVLANEVKHLKALLDEMKGSVKAVKQIHHESIRTEKRNEDSDESDDDQKREGEIGKIAVERDVLITENKALKRLLEELQSSEREIKHSPVQTYKAEKNTDDSHNDQHTNDDYGKLAVERDVLANEVKHLKALLDERNGSEKTVTQIHHESIRTEKWNEDSDESDDDQKREREIGKIAVERDVLIAENKALKKLLENLQSSERAVKHSPVQAFKAAKNTDDSDNEQRLIDDYGKLAVERDVLANEVKHLKALLDEMKGSKKAVKQIHHESIRTEKLNEDSDESDDEQKLETDIGKIAVERDVLFTENKALKKLLEELQSSEREIKHSPVQTNKAEKNTDDSDDDQHTNDDYGKLALERDVLANEVKHLKALLDEMKGSVKTVTQIHHESIRTEKWNEDSDDSDDDQKREKEIGKIAVERDVLITENKSLKKLLEELQSSERAVKHSPVQAYKAEKNTDDSDDDQHTNDDYGKLAVERDVLANEVKHLKALLDERNGSEKTVTQIHHESIRTEKRNDDSDDSDDEQKREREIGKIAVERDVLIAENKSLKKLLEELQLSERAVKHSSVHSYKAEKNSDDSDDDHHTNDDYGKLALERDVLANEVKHLKALLDEMKDSVKTVKQIHHESIRTEKRNEDSDDSDDDQKREKEIGKIAVERDVLITENKSLKKLLEELQSSERAVKHSPVQAYKAEKNTDDSDDDQHTNDDYGKLAMERDVLANEVKHLKALLDEMKGSVKTVKQIHHESIRTEKRNEDSDDSDDDQKREREVGKIAVERDVLIAENKALKKLLEELQSSERAVKHSPVQAFKAAKNNDDSDNEQRLIDDYGKLAVERDVLANEVKNLRRLLEELKTSELAVKPVHDEVIKIEVQNEKHERKYDADIGKIAVERDILASENNALKKLLAGLQSHNKSAEARLVKTGIEEADKDFNDGICSESNRDINELESMNAVVKDFGELAVQHEILLRENLNLKKLLAEMVAVGQKIKNTPLDYCLSRKDDQNFCAHENHSEELLKLAAERDALELENKSLKTLLKETSNSRMSGEWDDKSDGVAKDRELEELRKKLESFDKVTTERDLLREELVSLKLVLDTGATQTGLSTAFESKPASVLGATPHSEKSQEPVDLMRRLLEAEEANHRLDRSVSEMKEIAEKQSLIIQKKEKLIRAFHDKEKAMFDMEKQIDALKDINLRLSQRVAEQEEIAEKQSEIIKKKERRISEINIFEHDYNKLSIEKDTLSMEVKDLKLRLEDQRETNPEHGNLNSNLNKTAAPSESSLGSKYVVENDRGVLMAELEQVKQNREELLTEVSALEETLQDQNRTIMDLQMKLHKYEKIVVEVDTLKRELDIVRSKLRTEHKSTDLVDRGDKQMLKSQPEQSNESPLSSDDEESQVALNALRRKIAEKEKLIKSMDSMDEEKQFLEEEVEELHEKLKRQESTMVNTRPPVSDEDELVAQVKKLRRDLTDREREIERLKTEEVDEHRKLKNQIERLNQEAIEHPSHLTAEYETSLLASISDLEKQKSKLQGELRQNLEDREHEIGRIRNAEAEERRELKKEIERLKLEVNEHPSHLTADYEASLLDAIADLEQQKKKLQGELSQSLEDREHEIERLRNAEVEERRVLQNQIESLNKAVHEHPSHLTADFEADLLTKIADLEQQKKKLQSTLHEKEAQSDREIKDLVAANDDLMDRLTKVKKEAQRQYGELVEDNERLLESNGLLQKQCAELADEQEELMEKDRLLQSEVKKLKEELQEADNKWLKDKAKLDDDNKTLREQLEQQRLRYTKEVEDLQNHIASLLENINSATKVKEDTVTITKQSQVFGNAIDNQAEEMSKKNKEIAALTIKLQQHVEILAERDILNEKVERLEELLRKKHEPSERTEHQMAVELQLAMTDAHPPETYPDLREVVEMQEQTLANYEKKLNEQSKQVDDFGRLSVENDVLRRELKILRDLAEGSDSKEKDHKLNEKHQLSPTLSGEQEVAALKSNIDHLAKHNKELRKQIAELEFSLSEEKETFERKILELKRSLTKSDDDTNRSKAENKELRDKIEYLERIVVEKSSAVADGGSGYVQVSQEKETDRLENEILELKLKLTKSEEPRTQINQTSDERHAHLETLVQHLQSENSKLKQTVSQLESEPQLGESKTETKEKISASQLQLNQQHQDQQQQHKHRSSDAPEYDISYVRQLEDEMELLREVNRALSKDIADLQYRLTERLVLMRSDGIMDGDSDRDYLHKKMKDFTQQGLRYLTEIQDLEEKNRRARQELKTLRQENEELRDEVDTLQEICHLHYTSPKDLVNRMRTENNKLQQFIKILEERVYKKVSSVQNSETEIDVKSISAESFGLVTKQNDDLTSEEDASISSSQHLLFAGTLDECHQEIQRLRQINKDLEKRYKEIVSTYRSHLLASIQGRLDPEVKEALIRILRMKPVEYGVR